MSLPNDPVMLLSVVNMLLRDKYPSLDALCEGEDADKEKIVSKLNGINYSYSFETNQFI